jgi:hypothetical protein
MAAQTRTLLPALWFNLQFDESAKLRMKKMQEDAEKQRATRLKKLQDRNAAALNELDEQFVSFFLLIMNRAFSCF